MALDLIHSSMIDGPVGGAGLPVGAVVFSPTGAVFPGFLELNGQSCAEYPDLCALLGSGNVPDFRDRVPRHEGELAGLSGTTQEDATRVGLDGLDNSGSTTNNTLKGLAAHNPTVSMYGVTALSPATAYPSTRVKTSLNEAFDTRYGGAAETRVKSYIGKYLIKAASEVVNEGTLDMLVLAQTVSDKLNKGEVVGLVDNGAVIERGSNANGEFAKLADGTMICTRVVVETFSITIPYARGFYGTYRWNYPALFVETPYTDIECRTANHILTSGSADYEANADSGYFFLLDSDTTPHTSSGRARLIAVGRWK